MKWRRLGFGKWPAVLATREETLLRRGVFGMLAVTGACAVGVVVLGLWLGRVWMVGPLVAMIGMAHFVNLVLLTKLSGANFVARQGLRLSGYRTCPGCAYDLSFSRAEAGVCPECGEAFTTESLKQVWEARYKEVLRKPGN